MFNCSLAGGDVDQITDFTAADDVIWLDHTVFSGLVAGNLAAEAFRSNATGKAADGTDRLVSDSSTGNLYFDQDGNGASIRKLFATLNAGLTLSEADFVVL